MKLKSKIYTIIMLVLAGATVIMTGRLALRFAETVKTGSTYFYGTTIVIDPGHGGFDPGAVSDGHDEKDINLNISLKLADIFRINGYAVVMTRTTDDTTCDPELKGTSKQKRSDLVNRVELADSFSDSVLISIHQNMFSDKAQNGAQTFYGTQNENSRLLAECIQSSIVDRLQTYNERQIKKGTDSIYLLVNTKAPTVLVECGFMSNSSELSYLLEDDYCTRMAYLIYLGYRDYEFALAGG